MCSHLLDGDREAKVRAVPTKQAAEHIHGRLRQLRGVALPTSTDGARGLDGNLMEEHIREISTCCTALTLRAGRVPGLRTLRKSSWSG
jgi:hypothetical protein